MNIKDFKIAGRLGCGTFGKVQLVKHIKTGKLLALKELRKSKVIQLREVQHTKAERR